MLLFLVGKIRKIPAKKIILWLIKWMLIISSIASVTTLALLVILIKGMDYEFKE